MPVKANAERRHHIPKQRHRVTNSAAYDAALLEKHGTKTRRSWRKLHIAVDADIGQIEAATLTTSDVEDASQVSALLD